MEHIRFFERITGYQPYDFQKECLESIVAGNSIVITAPTGSGKSEIALVPFILSKNDKLPSQMVYSLPTRTLIENLSDRALKYAAFKNQSVAVHHGKRVESLLFDEDIIVTTIDQTVGAYICTPLNAPIRRGNIFAGGVSSAFLVFDEIHTFDPNRGLQTAITLIDHSSKLKMPVCIMSATLPSALVEKIETNIIKPNYDKVTKMEVKNEDQIKSRKNREVILHVRLNESERITPDTMIRTYNSLNDRKLIVICNTVDKAQTLFIDLHKNYEDRILREEIADAKLILVHSRFLDEDRNQIEREISDLFSRGNKEHVILISTQVVEVGINISANTILTELAPIDSLIQRAGRCARWGGNGNFIVFNMDSYGPYRTNELKEIIDHTKKELIKHKGETLTWDLERKLINDILTRYYTSILTEAKRYAVLGTLARAAYEGNKNLAEQSVREAYTCSVSIHDNPENLKDDVIKLEKINLNVWVFQSCTKRLLENDIKVLKIEESNVIDDYEIKYILTPITNCSEIMPFHMYIVSTKGAKYDSRSGLTLLHKGGCQFNKIEGKIMEERIKYFYTKKESWSEHARKTLNVLDNYFLPRFSFVIDKFANAFDLTQRDLINKIRVAVTLHDIGKLNIRWQEKVGWDDITPLAHSNKTDITQIGIPHATVSAVSLSKVFANWGKQIGIPFYLAIAHHHSLRATEYMNYDFVKNWGETIINVLPDVSDVDLQKRIIASSKNNGELEVPFIDISQEENIIPYKFYCFISKILRLSDWAATQGGINAVLCT
ncbi:MAG: CRISPR-associated helicase Cas3' [Candidatus Thermoplasmatota archaeon]